MKKSGFTLAEILLVLVIVGIIAAITIPALVRTIPNKDEENHKKLNYQLEQIVSMMYNDEGMYPKNDKFSKSGFKNTDSVMIKDRVFEGNTKFCELLAEQFEKTSSTVDCGTLDAPDVITFSTTDGMDWYVPKTTFANGWTTLKVDINGDKIRKGNKKNACSSKDVTDNPTQCKKPDLYTYFVRANGTIVVADSRDNLTNDSTTPYSVTFALECKGTNETNCGSAVLKTESGTTKGTVSGTGGTVSNLALGTYKVTVTPGSGYYSNYGSETRLVVIDGKRLDTKMKVLFAPIEKHCVYVNVNDCSDADLNNCGTYAYTGTQSGSLSQIQNSTTMHKCDLPSGNYQLAITPKSGLYIIPPPYDSDGERIDTYYQQLKMGTEDIYLNVTFTDNRPPDIVVGMVDLTPDDTVYPADGEWVEPEDEEEEP